MHFNKAYFVIRTKIKSFQKRCLSVWMCYIVIPFISAKWSRCSAIFLHGEGLTTNKAVVVVWAGARNQSAQASTSESKNKKQKGKLALSCNDLHNRYSVVATGVLPSILFPCMGRDIVLVGNFLIRHYCTTMCTQSPTSSAAFAAWRIP